MKKKIFVIKFLGSNFKLHLHAPKMGNLLISEIFWRKKRGLNCILGETISKERAHTVVWKCLCDFLKTFLTCLLKKSHENRHVFFFYCDTNCCSCEVESIIIFLKKMYASLTPHMVCCYSNKLFLDGNILY